MQKSEAGEERRTMVSYHVCINGIWVDAYYSQNTVNTVFLPLLQRLTALQQKKERRILVMLAAPPGCGKTTMAGFLEKLSREQKGLTPVQVIGMDGFHRRQEYLQSHYVERDGMRVPMVQIKGAPVTFDLQKLTDSVRKVASGGTCGWPVYDRMLHNPVEDALTVDGKIILLEGNYLLLDEEGWRELSSYSDYTISVTANASVLRSRLIARKKQTGVEKEAAVRFVDYSDMTNVYLCLRKTKKADLSLRLDDEGEYQVIDSLTYEAAAVSI